MKQLNCKKISCLVFIIISIFFCMAFVNIDTVNAESSNITIDSYTDNDYYLNNINIEINDYVNAMREYNLTNDYKNDERYASTVKLAQSSDNFYRLYASGDDPITELVPKYLFQSPSTELIKIGLEYGFFIKTEQLQDGVILANLFLFDIDNETDMVGNDDFAHFTVEPLFQREYLYFETGVPYVKTRTAYPLQNSKFYIDENFKEELLYTDNKMVDVVIPLPYAVMMDQFVFSDYNKYYLTNITSTIGVLNEQHLNIGDQGYDPYKDKGRFIIQADTEYRAKVYDTNKKDSVDIGAGAWVAVRALIDKGVDSLSATHPVTGVALNVLLGIYDLYDSAYVKSNPVEGVERKYTYKANPSTSQGQIEKCQGLYKTGGLTLNTDNISDEYGEGSFLYYDMNDKLTCSYQLGYTPVENENEDGYLTPWKARIRRGFDLTFTSKDGSEVYRDASIKDIEVNDGQEVEYKQLKVGEPNIICLLQNGENLFKFTPQYNGNYTLKTTGSQAEIILEQLNSTNNLNTGNIGGYDKYLSVDLEANKEYYFRITYADKNKYGIFNLNCEFTPQLVQLGNNTINLKYDDNYTKFVSDKNANYRFTSEDKDIVIHLLNEEFDIVQSSTNGELLIELTKGQTYYLRIDKESSLAENINLYIHDEMNVTFENIDGINESIEKTMIISSLDTIQLPVISKIGYTFEGWWTSLYTNGEIVNDDNILDFFTPNLTLYAKLTPIQYNIYFDEQGGEEIADMQYIIEHTVILPQNIQRENYVFGGWFDNAKCSGVAITEIPIGSMGDKTFYAKWINEKFIVTLDVNSADTDGESAELGTNSQEINYKQSYTLPIPVLDGFIFAGWWANDTLQYTDRQGVSLQPYMDENDVSLYAKWEREKFRIKVDINGKYKWLNINGEEFSFSDNEQYIENTKDLCPNCFILQYFKTDTDIGKYLQKTLWKEGGFFEYLSEDISVKTPNVVCWKTFGLANYNKNEDNIITLYAYFTAEQYFIDINLGGTPEDNIVLPVKLNDKLFLEQYATAPEGKHFTNYVVIDNDYNNERYKDTRFAPGQIFNETNMPDLSILSSGNDWHIYIKPVFEGNQYTVSLYDDTTYLGDKNVIFGQPYNTSNNNAFLIPQKTGYDFVGWYEYPNCQGIKYTDRYGNLLYTQGDIVIDRWSIPNDYTFYAGWQAVHSKVTFDKTEGIGGSDEVTAIFDQDMPLATAPTKTGHTFKGYFTEQNGKGVQYYNSNMLSMKKWDKTEETTLYADWEVNTYTITLDKQGSSGSEEILEVTYKSTVPNSSVAFKYGYNFKGYYSGENGTGEMYIDENGYGKKTWEIASNGILYAYWELIYFDVAIYQLPQYNTIAEFEATIETPIIYTAPDVDGYIFSYWEVWHGSNISPVIEKFTNKTLSIKGYASRNREGGYYYLEIMAHYEEDPNCIAQGSLITLADGRQVPVETLTGNEQLLVWNLWTGKFDTAPILFIDSDPMKEYEIINLYFSDGTITKVISEHAFWDIDLNKYVFLRNDANQYIGHKFNKQTVDSNGNMIWTSVKLVDVKITKEMTTAWSPVTYGHLCYYVNGMLSMPGGTTGLINIFEVNPDTMTIDMDAYYADIEQYGLFTYEEFAEIYPVSENVFNAFNGQYFKVAIGKGILTYDMIGSLIERYAEFLQ